MSSSSYFDEEFASDSHHLLSFETQTNDSSNRSIQEKQEFYEKKRFSFICVGVLLTLALVVGLWIMSIGKLLSEARPTHDDNKEETTEPELKRIEFDDVFNSSFSVKRASLVWVENDSRDGIYTFTDSATNNILLESIEDGESQVFVEAKDLQWRYSYLSNIYIYRRADKKLFPLTSQSTIDTKPVISYATWSPTGHQIAYVMNNDLYVTDLITHQRITFDGSKTVFNGVPDWVYEEEIYGTNFALWWSPDSSHVAFLKLDETKVPDYHLQLYTDPDESYPQETHIRYPKAGSPNPIASLHIHSLSAKETIQVTGHSQTIPHLNEFKDFEATDRLIVDVTWATTNHSHLLFKQTNRIQDHQYTSLVSLDSQNITRSSVQKIQEYKPSDQGWIDIAQSMVYLPSNHNVQFLDVLDNSEGFPHLAIVTVKEKGHSQVSWLTLGEWEVVSGTINVDPVRHLVHFTSTERSPYERHLYSLSLKAKDIPSSKVCLTCPSDPESHGYYTASFSPRSGYYILSYEGPGIPNTIVKKIEDTSFRSVLEDNLDLRLLLNKYDLPKTHMKKVTSGGIDMMAMETVPPDFDVDKKYPVLFHVYGGPGSQLVSHRFELSWQTFVASQLGYIVVTVDGRGTGFRGRKYKVGVRGRLGELEVIDQVNAGKHWAKLEYVDKYRMAIWGWSYGGYMTTRVIEANDGVFSTGMAVAPVTDWRYYGT
ncbi:dipeptidyl peptidase IV N-terminal region-domain-containing protein [Sporodiniella umbellata]|nr:dipeptidyl peptidase IV N-terminal region-domain-containing protein [Sporodiniella umbellata]